MTKNVKTYLKLKKYINTYKTYIIMACLILFILALTDGIIYKFLIPNLIDKGLISKNQDFITHAPFYIMYLFIIRGVASAMLNYIIGYIGKNIINTIKHDILLHLYKLPHDFFHQHSSGNIISKINYDTEQLSTTIIEAIPDFIKGLLIFTILSCVMLSINPYICITLSIITPLLVYALQKIGQVIKKHSISTQTSIGNITNASKEIVNLEQIIKSYNITDNEKNKLSFIIKHNKKNELKILFFQSLSIPIVQIIGALTLAATIYLYNIEIIKISIGEFTAIFTAMIGLLKPMRQIAQINTSLQKGLAAINSIFSLLNTNKETDKKKDTLKNLNDSIVFDNIYFKHKTNEKYTLNNITLNININDTIGIIGISGSGKTSLMNLLQKLHNPIQGNIFLDKINLNDVSLKHLRKHISVIHQNTMLFNDSIAYNITYGNKNISKKKLKKALIDSDCMPFVKKLKNNIHAQIGDNGSLLSGGQQQKLIIARLIFKNSPILILDEATSSLDLLSEKIIENYIKKHLNKKTIFIITHKFHILKLAKKIIILNNGTVKKIISYQDFIKFDENQEFIQ